jgi:hypothetical protein
MLSANYRNQVSEAAEARQAQCDVALAHLKSIEAVRNHPMLLLETPEETSSLEQIKLALSQNPKLKNHPDIKIEIQKSELADESPVKQCRNIQTWAAENRVRIELPKPRSADSPDPDWLKINKNEYYNWQIIQISMPVISDDGKAAYLNESQYYGPLAGGGAALTYKKLPNGTWKLADVVGRYIS